VLIVAGALIWFGVWSTKEKNYVSVTFLNVGEGDAVLIEGKNGNQILVDGGPGRETLAQLSKVVPFFDRMINSVIETYPDKDNGGGLPYVLRQYSVGAFFSSPAAIQSSIDDEIARITTEKHIPIQTLSSRMVFDLHDGSYLKVLSPSNDSNMKTSDASLVLEYVYNKTCFLIMGDAPEKTENDLAIKFGDTLHCQVLRVGHHGAKTSTGDALLSAVTPDYAIFSNSKDNRYAYPDQEVLDRLAGHNIKILNTKDSGTIKMISNGQTVSRI
jgi:beta-lactamase superfamily II metal-dependent hydrolase